MNCHNSQPWTNFFACWIFIFGLLKPEVNYIVHRRYTRILDSKPLITITLNIERSWNIFSLHIFSSMLLKQVINLRKVRRWELEIQYRPSRSSCVWLVSSTVDNCFQLQIAQNKNWSLSSQCRPLDGFLYLFSFATVLAINFGWQWLIQIHAWDCFQALVQNTVWSWLWTEFEAVIFDSNWLEPKQTSFSWTGLRFRSPAFQYLHKIRSGTCWFYAWFNSEISEE